MQTVTTPDQAFDLILQHPDAGVRAAAEILKTQADRRKRILELVQETLAQLRLDMKYIIFDLECTRRERDEAKGVG